MRKLVLGTAFVLSACGPSERTGTGAQPDAGSPSDGSPSTTPSSRVYAHSGDTLYLIDTQTFAPMPIGTMSGLGTQSLTDLAIDKSDNMIGVTLDKLYSIDETSGAATLITDLSGSAKNFTSLSFAPENYNDPNSNDILIAANSFGEVYEIDPTTGTANLLGDYGSMGPDKIGSSGDLIAVRNFGIYATVNIGTNPASQDYLARIDPTTWIATPIGGGTGFNDIFGLGYWEGKIYGFVSMGPNAGKMITIDPATGAGTEVHSGSIRWYGAGVATDAPILQ